LQSSGRSHPRDAIRYRGLKPEVPVDVTVEFAASALPSLLTWWLDTDQPYTAEEMASMFQRLASSGVAGAVGSST
jgi:hypothetical protein